MQQLCGTRTTYFICSSSEHRRPPFQQHSGGTSISNIGRTTIFGFFKQQVHLHRQWQWSLFCYVLVSHKEWHTWEYSYIIMQCHQPTSSWFRGHFKGTILHCLIAATPNLRVLNAKRNNLRGIIPNKFGKTCMFQTLNFNGNFLQGQIPRSIIHCKELKVIDFGNNQLNDTFPCELKRLSKLQVLILRSNKFSGSIDCQKENSTWSSLQILDLASNHFSGDLKPQYFVNWTSMMAGMNKS